MSVIQAMITGSLTKDAELKRGQSGKDYLAMVVKIDSGAEKPHFCRANLFGDDCDSVAKLKKGDSVSLVGKLEIGIWQASDGPSPSLSMMAHRAISPAARKPKRKAEEKSGPAMFKKASEFQSPLCRSDLRDDIP